MHALSMRLPYQQKSLHGTVSIFYSCLCGDWTIAATSLLPASCDALQMHQLRLWQDAFDDI